MKHYEESLFPVESYHEIDVVISKSCTLNCEYCYVHKLQSSTWDGDKILASLDKVFSEVTQKGVIVGIYPEPWVDINRTNKFMKDVLMLMEEKYPKFFDEHIFMLGTNGVNLHKVIPIVEHSLSNLYVGVTIDGIKEQHDLYRKFRDGSGSWDMVTKNVKKYQQKFNIYSTKVTLGTETIKYMYDSTRFLWDEMGLNDVNMNVVFEDVWGNKLNSCLAEYERQLEKLTRYVIDNKMWEQKKYVSVIGVRNIPHEGEEFKAVPYCGATEMRTVDVDGGVYPCIRLAPFNADTNRFNLENKGSQKALKLYNVYDAAPKKCLQCKLLPACPMCVGGAILETKQIYSRTTHHCEFTKLQYKYAKIVDDAINGR